MAKNDYEDQHITPQKYLNRFGVKTGKEYMIGVWQKGTARKEPKLFQNLVKNVGYIKNFYDVGTREDIKYWEKYYAKHFDPLYGKCLDSVIAKITLSPNGATPLTEQEKRILARIICSQMLKGPNYINKQLAEAPFTIKTYKESIIHGGEPYLSKKTIEKIRSIDISNDEIKDWTLSHITDEKRIERFADVLLDRLWLIYINTTCFDFMTSDCPVLQYNLLNNSTDERYTGIGRSDTAIIFALTPHIMLHLLPSTFCSDSTDKHNGEILFLGQSNLNFIFNYNTMQLQNCYQQAFMTPEMMKTVIQMEKMSEHDKQGWY